MRFHSILAKVATGLFLVVEMTAASAAVTFNINQTVGAGSVVGQVMTDGAIGTVLAPKVRNPVQADHRFRSKPITESETKPIRFRFAAESSRFGLIR